MKKKKLNFSWGKKTLLGEPGVFERQKILHLSSSKKNGLGAPSGFSAFKIEVLFLG
jgi:hypothetical protein